MAQGNPNPSPATRFKPGVSPNPGGKTSEQRLREQRNAEMATIARERMLESEMAKMAADPGYIPALSHEMLKLIKDSEDRGLGAPKQTVDADVRASVTRVRLLGPDDR